MLAFFALLGLYFSSVSCVQGYSYTCEVVTNMTGVIHDFADYEENYSSCWRIKVPKDHYIRFNFTKMNFRGMPCHNGYVSITEWYSDYLGYKFCSSEEIPSNITFNGDAEITYYHNSRRERSSFKLKYYIENDLCDLENHFRCSNFSCINTNQVCDGIEDCEDGSDEFDCDTDTKITSIRNLIPTRLSVISWLKKQRTPFFGWDKNTHRAITALYLSGGASFNESNMEEELMVKQLELETAVALLRNSSDPLSVNDLSMFINALLVTCHDPSQFYGYNLVHILRERVAALKSPSPGSYLTLCNANFTFSVTDVKHLLDKLQQQSEYPFYTDIQAMTVLAVNCMKNETDSFYNETDSGGNVTETTIHVTETTNDVTETTINVTETITQSERGGHFNEETSRSDIYNKTIRKLIESQQSDGSFGNVYTTSLVTQALLSSGEQNSNKWNVTAALQYLMLKMKSPSLDFLSATLTLPVLNGKTLLDIGKVQCSKKRVAGKISDVTEKLVRKMQVQYSLFIGDEKDIIHTIYLRVPENSSAYDVMRVAQVADPKYKFLHSDVSGSMYIYEIAGITNDPEAGKFWLLYSGHNAKNATLTHTKSPDKLTLTDGQHLVMWYRTINY